MAKSKEGKITDLVLDNRNVNRHKKRGKELLQKSVEELGIGRPILADAKGMVIAGNSTLQTAIDNGYTKIILVESTGTELIVHKRTDLDLNDPGEAGRKARAMAIVDNSSALQGIEFDIETANEIGEEFGFDVSEWGLEEPEQGEGFDMPDYSGKNKEIDANDFEDKCSITLNYTLEEFHQVKAELSKIAATPEQAVWQLLKLPE